MNTRTADEIRIHHIDTMGEPLGCLYSSLWQETASIHQKWGEFLELFGKNEERVKLLNDSAPQFFRMIQNVLWSDIILHIARMTDPKKSAGKRNLSIQAITELLPEGDIKISTGELVKTAVSAASFCRDWRNRHLAHRDLDLSLDKSATPLEPASRASVKVALEAIANVLNAVSYHYEKSENFFNPVISHSGAEALLYVIDEGVTSRNKRYERISNRIFTKDDIEFHSRKI
ncbi:hypothetical protein [Azospirillum sp.]|uniref:AbiU2 domain-containing protein n=1 Tax=Azospirillum sp. TaxID=34012 RepID=UPI00261960BD|nr:hypothetical protein [Azospirillum sp.]